VNRLIDTLALYGISVLLAVAFYYQFALGELPCPLCALQRVGFLVAGVALILNLRSGYAPAHYGLVLLTAVAAGSASLRQIALHVVPGSGSYGSALFGLHFYTWAFVGYGALIVYVGAMLLVGGKVAGAVRPRPLDTFEIGACALFVGLAAVNVIAFLLECGLGPCPDDPTGYLWLPWAR
jgi:disulfide bond formation protein DsbB